MTPTVRLSPPRSNVESSGSATAVLRFEQTKPMPFARRSRTTPRIYARPKPRVASVASTSSATPAGSRHVKLASASRPCAIPSELSLSPRSLEHDRSPIAYDTQVVDTTRSPLPWTDGILYELRSASCLMCPCIVLAFFVYLARTRALRFARESKHHQELLLHELNEGPKPIRALRERFRNGSWLWLEVLRLRQAKRISITPSTTGDSGDATVQRVHRESQNPTTF